MQLQISFPCWFRIQERHTNPFVADNDLSEPIFWKLHYHCSHLLFILECNSSPHDLTTKMMQWYRLQVFLSSLRQYYSVDRTAKELTELSRVKSTPTVIYDFFTRFLNFWTLEADINLSGLLGSVCCSDFIEEVLNKCWFQAARLKTFLSRRGN